MDVGSFKVLLVEDNPGDARLVQEALREAGQPFEIDVENRLDGARRALEDHSFDVVLLDLSLPDSSGVETFRKLVDLANGVPVVVLSGLDDADVAAEAMKAGAQDYLVKGRHDPELFARAVTYAIQRHGIVKELQDLNRVKSEFVAVASHELRSPLTSIIAFAHTLERKWQRIGEEQRVEFVGRIHTQATRLLRLANDLLVMSRIELGALEPDPEDVEVADEIRRTLDELGDEVAGVRVSEVSGRVHVDLNHLHQILTNYVTNALRYGEPPVEIRAEREDGYVVVRVCDQGPGVPEEFVPNLFEKFMRADSQAKTGTGLGLSIVRGLAASAGGEAWYEPGQPRGARFCVRLPAAG